MFEDQDLQKDKDRTQVNELDKEKNILNTKLVQDNKEKNISYQDKLHDNKIAEDIFEDQDQNSSNARGVIKPGDLNEKSGVSPMQPLTNYEDLVEESRDLRSDKIKPLYFIVGLVVILILIAWFGFFIYKQFFTGERDSGEIILNTEPEEIQLDNDTNKVDKIIEPGINVNSTAISSDIDEDGLSNEEEEVLKTDPESSDTDRDGLSDREEVKIYHTDPLHEDTDGDSYLDGEEVKNGYNPLGSGKLFDFSLITDEYPSDNFTETTIKELIKPNIDINDWSSFSTNDFNLSFKYPFDWSINEEENKIIVSPLDSHVTDYMEIEIRENIFQLDLVDWLSTQEDYPDFKQDQLKINEEIALVVHSDDSSWQALSSMFIAREDVVYNFNFFSEDSTSNNFNTFQMMVLSSTFRN
jgi:Bacterial TSP3 repeat